MGVPFTKEKMKTWFDRVVHWFTKDNIWNLTKKVPLLFFGVMIGGMGCSMFYIAGLGLDAITVLCDGLGKIMGTNVSEAMNLYNIVILLLALVFGTRYVGLGTVINALFVGRFMGLFNTIFGNLLGPEPAMWIRIVFMLIGIVVMSFGFGMYITVRAGTGPADSILLTISDKTGWQYRALKIMCDATYMVVGFLMGGTVGVGTVIAVFTVGPIINIAMLAYNKTVIKWFHIKVKPRA